MINKNEKLGKKLSSKEMKQVQGGLAPCAMIECGGGYCSACHYRCVHPGDDGGLNTNASGVCVGIWEIS